MIKNKLDELVVEYYADKTKLSDKVTEILFNIQQVRCMKIGEILNGELKDKYGSVFNLLLKKSILGSVLKSGISSIELITPLVIYILGVYQIQRNSISMGELVSFVTLSVFFLMPFNSVNLVVPQIKNLREAMLRLNEFLFYNEEINKGDVNVCEFEDLYLKNVGFSYNKQGKNLYNVNLHIKRGERIAIVGASGSGKSTLLKVIMNMMSKYEGEILLNGHDLKSITQESLNKIFTAVTQIPVAFNRTIKDNIDIVGKMSDGEVERVLSLVELEEFVNSCPLGIYTYIGENGQNISGGQKQRIVIARAIAQKSDIIVFDEGTSNLDIITENKIYENLYKKGITQIVVTHRLHTIKKFDRIYVLNEGNIVEEGSHDQLLQKKGKYYKMFESE